MYVPQNGRNYERKYPVAPIPDPEWPDLSMADIIRIAFTERGWLVNSIDHVLIQKLDGRR